MIPEKEVIVPIILTSPETPFGTFLNEQISIGSVLDRTPIVDVTLSPTVSVIAAKNATIYSKCQLVSC